MVRNYLPGATVALLGVLAGCSEPTGTALVATGDVTITLQQAAAPSLNLVADLDDGAVAAPEARVPASMVSSLEVTITDVQLLRRCDAEEDGQLGDEEDPECGEDYGWYPLTLDEPVTVDLATLPAEDAPPVVIAAGALPVGDYENIRLFVQDEKVVFAEAFSVGQSLFDADTEYSVEIPSGDNTGIKTDLTLVVTADADGNPEAVNLLFDSDATFRGAVATGSGKVILPPVLKVRQPS